MSGSKSTPWYRDKEFFEGVMRIGMPVALQNLMTSTLSMIDSMMIGSVGETSLAAVGMAGQWGSLLFSAYWGLCCGGTMFFSQYWGAGDIKGIRRAFSVTLMSMMAVGLIFCLLALLAPAWVLAIYTNDPDVQRQGAQYLQIMSVGYLAQVASMAMSGLLRSTENVKLPLFASLASIATNTFVNWLLIYGNWGLPALGVRGAAIASVLAAFVNLLIILGASASQGNVLMGALRRVLHIEWRFIGEYFRKSSPIIANELFYGFAVMAINMVMGRQGAANLSALTVFRTLEGLIFAFFGGLSNASSVMVGKSIGAGELDKGLRDAKRFALLCPAMSFLVCLVVLALRRPIVGLFGVSGSVAATVMSMLMIYTVTAPMRTSNYIQVNIFRSGGETRMGMFLEVGGIWLVGVPLVYLTGMVWHLPFLAIFVMFYVEDAIKCFIEPLYLASGRWIRPVTPQGQAALAAFRDQRKRRRGRAA